MLYLLLFLGSAPLLFAAFTKQTVSPIQIPTRPPPEYPCPAQDGVYATCSLNTVYLIDCSSDLTKQEINDEFDWLRNNIIPGTGWNMKQEVGWMQMSGGDQSYALLPERKQGCDELEELQQTWKSYGSSTTSVLGALITVAIYYSNPNSFANSIVLFSASQNTTDISAAADFVRTNLTDKTITVVAMKGATFSGFPATVIYNVPSLNPAPLNLASCVIKGACSVKTTCDPNSVPDLPVYWPTRHIPRSRREELRKPALKPINLEE